MEPDKAENDVAYEDVLEEFNSLTKNLVER